jgi:hypothetical protein
VGLHHVWCHRVKVDTSVLQAVGSFPVLTSCTTNDNFTSSRHTPKMQPRHFPASKPSPFFLSLPFILLSCSLTGFVAAAYGFTGPSSHRNRVIGVTCVVALSRSSGVSSQKPTSMGCGSAAFLGLEPRECYKSFVFRLRHSPDLVVQFLLMSYMILSV